MYERRIIRLSHAISYGTRLYFFSLWIIIGLQVTPSNSYASSETHSLSLSPTGTKSDKRWISTEKMKKRTIIIRKSKESDLVQISDMLANESIDLADGSNWSANIKKLKALSSFRTQILHRLQATEAATAVRSYPEFCDLESTATDRDICRLLWSQKIFRSKLEKAAKTASSYEGANTLWEKHNFNVQPSDPMIMNHIMVTAVDVDYVQGKRNCNDVCIVGFCEIAMLPIPSTDNERRYAPCIANLVVSPNHRRRGVASRLLRNAERFVKLHWSETIFCHSPDDCDLDEDDLRIRGILGLYVDKGNEAATNLYLRKNFKISKHSSTFAGRYFMEKDICGLRN